LLLSCGNISDFGVNRLHIHRTPFTGEPYITADDNVSGQPGQTSVTIAKGDLVKNTLD
jgi:hypothetical protein